MSYFPMFVQLKDRCCLVVGGGRVALRKAKMLEDFEARVTVVSPKIMPELKERKNIICLEKRFEEDDLKGQELVIAATDDIEQNRRISRACMDANIPVNAVDQIDDCSFIFPAYLKEGEVVAAFSSGGLSPVIAQHLKSQMKETISPHLGHLAACLGNLRDTLKACIDSAEDRKNIYEELLRFGLETGTIPSDEEIKKVMEKYIAF